jgi:16S rRNA (adenine1518-N6/adenine1519-N6)-dimethyltransferase
LRIAAAPSTAEYGRLSVLCQWRCTAQRLFDVNRSAFTPPPKITSSIVHLVPRQQPYPNCSVANLERVTASAFGQRRKMLRSSLKGIFSDPLPILEQLDIDPALRAENLTVEQFGLLALVADRLTTPSSAPAQTQ